MSIAPGGAALASRTKAGRAAIRAGTKGAKAIGKAAKGTVSFMGWGLGSIEGKIKRGLWLVTKQTSKKGGDKTYLFYDEAEDTWRMIDKSDAEKFIRCTNPCALKGQGPGAKPKVRSERLQSVLDEINDELPQLLSTVNEEVIEEVIDALGEDVIDNILHIASRRTSTVAEEVRSASELLDIAREIKHIEGVGDLFEDLASRSITTARGTEFELRWVLNNKNRVSRVAVPRVRKSRPLKGADVELIDGSTVELKNFNLGSKFYSQGATVAARRIRRQVKRRLQEGFNNVQVIFSSDAGSMPSALSSALRRELDDLANSEGLNPSSLSFDLWP